MVGPPFVHNIAKPLAGGPGIAKFEGLGNDNLANMFLVSSLEDADHLFFGCLSRVRELADILHGVFCHDTEVFLFDTQPAQVLRDTDLFGNLTDGSNGFSCRVHGGETVNVFTHGFCDIAEAVCVADQVEFLYVRQQDCVADTVRKVVETAQLVSHSVNITEGSVVEAIPARYWP